jgi:hypothetical protein
LLPRAPVASTVGAVLVIGASEVPTVGPLLPSLRQNPPSRVYNSRVPHSASSSLSVTPLASAIC